MLTFDELRCAIIMMKRAPLKGEESLTVAQTILKMEQMARALAEPAEVKQIEEDGQSDDTGTTE